MKHLKLLLLSLAALFSLISGDAVAAPVKPERAREAALNFFGAAAATSSLRADRPRLEMVWDGETTATRSASDPAFFVYNRTDAPGFVIISGDDRFPSLLGYSFENSFRTEAMPDNMRWWFSAWRSMILRVRSDADAPVKWDAATRAGETERLLRTADWDQGPPYNNDCPLYGGRRTLTGCVQTAAAIVVKYHRWPDRISGTAPSYTTRTLGLTVPSRMLRDYDYDLLPDSYASGYSAAEAVEVARLMADLGVMCEADYGLDGTAAYTENLCKAMVTYMRYDKQATIERRNGYTEWEWNRMMKSEIDAGRPVLYAGDDGTAGHQFVLDGYSDRNLFHFNWGWSGYGNGWFYFEAPDYTFRNNQCAIVGLKKDPNGTSEYAAGLCLTSLNHDRVEYRGITTERTVFRTGEPFVVRFGGVGNLGWTTFSGRVKLAVCDPSGAIKEDLSEERPVENLELFHQVVIGDISCTIRNPIAPGDRIRAYCRQQGRDKWVMMRRYQDDVQQEILLAEDTVDPAEIAAATSLAYDRATRRLTLRTLADASVRLLASGGDGVFETVAGGDAIPVDLSAAAAGEYTLTIGFEKGEPYTLRIVL